MNSPKIRSTEILRKVQSQRDPRETKRARISMLLAAKISAALNAQGWSKLRFAQALDKKPSVITKWLSGTHNFTTDTLTDIQDLLGIDLLNQNKEH